jgi:aspartyl-tRNA synthetase
MERVLAKDLGNYEEKEIAVTGWVDVRRDHGKLIFIDLRDRSGISQIIFLPGDKALQAEADRLRPEWVAKVTGVVKKRPAGMENKNIPNGAYEIAATKLEIINEAKTPPFEINADGRDVNEEIRMKHRYLDLRRPRLQRNIRERDRVISFFRDYMHAHDFVEIETPILMKGTPEGAREYLVPSRVYPGNFYALPQSPQQFKQLSMVAGFERYFQIARCFRDEDTRGDRQPEFTQLDFEMSFVSQEDVLSFTEAMFIALVEKLFPEKTISSKPFPRLTYAEAMEKYGSDKPDLRKDKNDPNELAFAWVVDFPMFEKTADGELQAMHHPFCAVHEEDTEKFMKGEDIFSIRANSYDLVLNGYELSSGSIRIHESAMQKKVFELLEISEEEQQKKFGHMLEAFEYGAPPHGGFAPGIDRVLMILLNEPNIREVIPFPKTGDGRDLMMDAPSETSKKQLDELHLEIKNIKK